MCRDNSYHLLKCLFGISLSSMFIFLSIVSNCSKILIFLLSAYFCGNFVTIATVKVKLIPDIYTWAIGINCILIAGQNSPLMHVAISVTRFAETWLQIIVLRSIGSGSVVEYLTRDRGVAGSSLTASTALCPRAQMG